MPQYVEHAGEVIEFPDTMSDAQIASVLKGRAAPAAAAPAAPAPGPITSALSRAADYVTEPLVNRERIAQGESPAQVYRSGPDVEADRAKRSTMLVNPLAEAVTGPANRMAEDATAVGKALANPKPSVTLPLALPGGGTVVTRLGAFGAGKMLEEPSDTYTGNLKTAAKGIVGDWNKPVTMATSPAAMEVASPLLSKILSATPGAKARINEDQSQELLNGIGRTNRVAREAIEAAPVSDLQRAPRTAAAIKRGFESGAVEDATQQRFRDVLGRVDAAAGNPTFNGPALQRAYSRMPPDAQIELVGNVGPNGFTLTQAQAVRSWVASPAYSQSTLGQGVGPVPQQRLAGAITQEMEQGLANAPRALQLWRANNRAYGGTEALQEALTQGNAFQGQPNRLFLNRNALSDYLAKNEKDLVPRMGRQGFDYLVEHFLGGAQPGTRDILASGAGTAADAAMQSIGRGTNTGSIQALGVPARTLLPNVGSQYTGRPRYALSPALQTILDAAMQKAGGAALSGDHR